MVMAPPVPPVAAPVVTDTAPEEGSVKDPVRAPVLKEIFPVLPSAVVPVEKRRLPLSPALAAFADLTLTLPEDCAAPSPEAIVILPPVLALEAPPVRAKLPPLIAPAPPATLIIPPKPSEPVESPARSEILPPVFWSSEVFPDSRVILPPSPLSPAPTATVKAPARPPALAPVPNSKAPLFPTDVVPVVKASLPEAPAEPAFVVKRLTDPEVVGAEWPPLMYT
jgi:hypothetical protein